MPQMFKTECPQCHEIISWCYERSVYESYIQCPECGKYIKVE